MIHATLDGNRIHIRADDDSAAVASKLRGIWRTPRMQPCTWYLPLSTDSIDALRDAGARGSPELIARAAQLAQVREYVEAQKQADQVQPLLPIPLKRGVALYNHQIKAFNICLALYGYLVLGGDVQ